MPAILKWLLFGKYGGRLNYTAEANITLANIYPGEGEVVRALKIKCTQWKYWVEWLARSVAKSTRALVALVWSPRTLPHCFLSKQPWSVSLFIDSSMLPKEYPQSVVANIKTAEPISSLKRPVLCLKLHCLRRKHYYSKTSEHSLCLLFISSRESLYWV